MFLPYATDQPTQKRPWMTLALASFQGLITLSLLLGAHFWQWNVNTLLYHYGLVPARLHLWNLLTYSFLHADPAHLLLNLFFLWVFGTGVESAIGGGKLLALYLLSGAIGGWLQCLIILTLLPPEVAYVPIIGASAACAGLVGAYAVRYYRARISFALLPIRPHVVLVVAIFLAGEIGSGLWRLWVGDTAYGVAHWAHIGGFVTGLTAAYLLRLPQKAQMAYLTRDAAQALEQNRPGAAIPRWEAVLQKHPDDANAHAELARAWEIMGDQEQAAIHFNTALDIYLKMRMRSMAVKLYLEMQSHHITQVALSPAQQYFLACALEEGAHLTEALTLFRQVAQESLHSPEAETALLKAAALCARYLHHHEEARQLIALFHQRYPHSQWRHLADCLARELETSSQSADSPTSDPS
jgi:membrane associated rhomboid family serine protease